MARIDLARRAEIGRDRRAKTRAQLLRAARALYAQRGIEAVTIDDLVKEARVAKGTFYAHFDRLADLQAAVADELMQTFDGLLQPLRQTLADPIDRVAAGSAAFIGEALRDPAWGRLAACGASALSAGSAVRTNLTEDLKQAAEKGRLHPMTAELAFDVVTGIVIQVMRAAGQRRLSPAKAPVAVEAILRAIGIAARESHAIVDRILPGSANDAPAFGRA